ncbi:glycosyltransferase family 4 protein, partial [bacterium]|nr:glycosyltransferase family 4 protein [bacterium]
MGCDCELFKLQVAALGGLLFLSLSVTWVILYYVRLLDHPNERSSHELATPKCGGVGIVVSFVAGVFVSQLWGGEYLLEPRKLWSLVIPVLLVACVSLADDIQELTPGLRLGVQVLAAALFLYMSNMLPIKPCGGIPPLIMQCVWGGVAMFWLVGMANAFNFMDGIDGLAAGQGLIASLFFAIIHIGKGVYFPGFVSLVMVVGCLGFLAFNFPPAKVFMGDVGSVSMGFILAALALYSYQKNPSLETLLIMPLLMSNFIFDTVVTFVRRLLKRERLFQAHRSHLYQQFAGCGFSQRTVTMTNYGMAIIQGEVVLMMGQNPLS